MSPEECKCNEAVNLATARQMEELECRWVEEIHQAEANITHLHMIEAVDSLHCSVSPDDKDILDKALDLDDLSSDAEKDRKVVMGMKRKRMGKDGRKRWKTKLVKALEGCIRSKDSSCDSCYNHGIECIVHPQYCLCFECKHRKIKNQALAAEPDAHPAEAHAACGTELQMGASTYKLEASGFRFARGIGQRGSRCQNTIAAKFLKRTATLDSKSEDSFQPSDDIVQCLESLPSEPTPFPGDRVPEGDVEMMEVWEDREELAGRPSPESEDVPGMGTDVPRAWSINLDTLIVLPVKEETLEWVQMGMTQEQYISHKIRQLLEQKEKKEWRQAEQRVAEERRMWEEEEEVVKKAQAAVETTALHAAINLFA
ncbi:hypothetical protein DFH08DRAFT_827166 [Mycena albidolilacea]|uniref:Uncharacterized protein n=1 Tax=Mycena albidolilacea TaxID=1033008 RepID=A0AAD7E8G4_9AGAR|nr:hypothetical protein DFH08DRAFT_827166 [Mycena albidolilacea]